MLTSETSYLQLDHMAAISGTTPDQSQAMDSALSPSQGIASAAPRSGLPLYLLPLFTWEIRTVAPGLRHSTRV